VQTNHVVRSNLDACDGAFALISFLSGSANPHKLNMSFTISPLISTSSGELECKLKIIAKLCLYSNMRVAWFDVINGGKWIQDEKYNVHQVERITTQLLEC